MRKKDSPMTLTRETYIDIIDRMIRTGMPLTVIPSDTCDRGLCDTICINYWNTQYVDVKFTHVGGMIIISIIDAKIEPQTPYDEFDTGVLDKSVKYLTAYYIDIIKGMDEKVKDDMDISEYLIPIVLYKTSMNLKEYGYRISMDTDKKHMLSSLN